MVMIYIVYLFSLATFFIGILIILKPSAVYDFISVHSQSFGIHILAVFVRAFLGLARISHEHCVNFLKLCSL